MSSDKLITLAISMPYAGTSWPAGEGVSPALLKAINSVNADPLILPDHTLTWFWYDTQCDPVYAGLGKTVLDSFFPHAFIGPACSTVVAELIDEVYGHPLTGVPFDRPLISWGAGNAMFADKDKYPMFSRVVASYAGHNNAVVALANQYGWDKLGILATSDSLWGTTLKLLKQDLFALDAEMVVVESAINADVTSTTEQGNFFVDAKADGIEVFVLLGYCGPMRDWLDTAESAIGLEGNAFILYDFDSSCAKDNGEEMAYTGVWTLVAKSENTQKQTDFKKELVEDKELDFAPYLQFPFGTATPKADAVSAQLEHAMSLDTRTFVPGNSPPDDYALFMHDAILLFATAAHNLIEDTGQDWFTDDSFPTLSLINNYIRGVTIDGASGEFELDSKGERNLPISYKYIVADSAAQTVTNVDIGEYDPYTGKVEWGAEELVWAGNVVGGAAPGTVHVIFDATKPSSGSDIVLILVVCLVAILGAGAGLLFMGKGAKEAPPPVNTVPAPVANLEEGNREQEMQGKFMEQRRASADVRREVTNQLEKEVEELKKDKAAKENEIIQRSNVLSAKDLILKKTLRTRPDGTREESPAVLGQGAYGKVFEGNYFGTAVAVKEIQNNLLDIDALVEDNMLTAADIAECLKNEIKFAQMIRHPNVITCVGFVENELTFYMVMELGQAGSLKDVLQRDVMPQSEKTVALLHHQQGRKKKKPLTAGEQLMSTTSSKRKTDEVVALFLDKVDEKKEDDDDDEEEGQKQLVERELGWKQKYEWLNGIAMGLEFLHGQRICYRDLKCDNVLITGKLEAKLADWGTCVQTKSEDDLIFGRCGTLAFMAPEVFSENDQGYNHRADVYSFGVLVLELGLHGNLIEGIKELDWIDSDGQEASGKCKSVGIFLRRMCSGMRPSNFKELLRRDEEEDEPRVEMLNDIMCTVENPSERPTAKEVHAILQKIVDEDRRGNTKTLRSLRKKGDGGEEEERSPFAALLSDGKREEEASSGK